MPPCPVRLGSLAPSLPGWQVVLVLLRPRLDKRCEALRWHWQHKTRRRFSSTNKKCRLKRLWIGSPETGSASGA